MGRAEKRTQEVGEALEEGGVEGVGKLDAKENQGLVKHDSLFSKRYTKRRMRQRKRDQLHIFRRTLIDGQPLSFQLHFPIPNPPSDHITHPPTISSNWQKT